jgi:hypothetical protein
MATTPASKREVLGQMHYIAADLETNAWVDAGFTRLEQYLARWRLFTDRYGDDSASRSEADGNRRKPN